MDSNAGMRALIASAVVVLFTLTTPTSVQGAVRPTAAQGVAAPEPAAPAGPVKSGDLEGTAVHSQQYGTLIPSHGHKLGWGWSSSTDQRMGGYSAASTSLLYSGADGTLGALRVSGDIKPGFPSGPWAGAVWFPGREPTEPADLSAKHELEFWARGTPGSYNLMPDAGTPGATPLHAHFVTIPQWKEYQIPLATSYPNADWKHVYFMAFTAGYRGKFQFDPHQVSLY